MTTATATAALNPPIARPARPDATTVAAERPVVVARAAAARRATPAPGPRPRHQVYRGTRILAFVLLGFAGLGVLALGAMATQILGAFEARGYPAEAPDRALLGLLLRVAPFVMVAGIGQLLVSWAVLRDKPGAMRAGRVMAIAGGVAALVGATAVGAGATPTFAKAASDPATSLVGALAWTAALDALGALTLARIIRGRSTP